MSDHVRALLVLACLGLTLAAGGCVLAEALLTQQRSRPTGWSKASLGCLVLALVALSPVMWPAFVELWRVAWS